MIFRLATIAILLTANVALQADNVFTVTGTNSFGFGGSIFASGLRLSTTYTGVSITMQLGDLSSGGPIGGTEGTAYLMNQIGTGTTSGNIVAGPVTISGLTAAFTPQLLFSGLTLTPGNYFIVLVPQVQTPGTPSLSPQGASTPNFTDTAGVGVLDLGNTQLGGATAAFAPATTNLNNLFLPTNFFMTITGTQTGPIATPVPSSLILLLTGLACVGLYGARRKFARRAELG
jgi:hypothetical protein